MSRIKVGTEWQSQFSPKPECEIVLERRIDALMRSAIERAGAKRGLLILRRKR